MKLLPACELGFPNSCGICSTGYSRLLTPCSSPHCCRRTSAFEVIRLSHFPGPKPVAPILQRGRLLCWHGMGNLPPHFQRRLLTLHPVLPCKAVPLHVQHPGLRVDFSLPLLSCCLPYSFQIQLPHSHIWEALPASLSLSRAPCLPLLSWPSSLH